jgi:predicted aspartyl protease
MNGEGPARRRVRTWLWPALLLGASLALCGCQALGAWAIGRMSPIEWNGQERVELPLTLDRAGSPTVPVRVMGHDGTALVDTGSSLSVISRAFATAADVQMNSSGPKVNGARRSSAEDVQVGIGPVSTTALMTVVHDGNEPQFVLGMTLFLQSVVEMDFDTGRLTLIRPDTFVPPPGEPLKVKLLHAAPTIPLYVNGSGNKICALVDTGFYSGLALQPGVLEKLALPTQPSGGTVVTYGAFGFQQENPALAPVDNVQIGGLLYREVHVGHAPPWSKDNCGNLLGMNVLYRHRLIFDLKNRRFWLLPRTGNQW